MYNTYNIILIIIIVLTMTWLYNIYEEKQSKKIDKYSYTDYNLIRKYLNSNSDIQGIRIDC